MTNSGRIRNYRAKPLPVNGIDRYLRIAAACVAGLALGSLVGGTLGPLAYTKDIQTEYLTALALREGVDHFTRISDLSARYFPVGNDLLPDPSWHPPVLALVSVPFTLLPFPLVALLWLALNVGLLIAVGRWLGMSVQWSLPLAAWPPLWCLLYIGQYELLILALAMLGWRAAADARDWRAGVWLGLAASIKLYPALLLVPFVVRRRLRVVLAAGGVLMLSQLGNLAVIGPAGMVQFYREIIPSVSARYVATAINSSPYGALLRLFGGAHDAVPLIDAPGIVLPLAAVISLFALIALLKLEPERAPAALLVGLPIVWATYVVLALPMIVELLRSPLRRAAVLPAAAASCVLPLVSLFLLHYMRWTGNTGPPVAAILAVQPVGFLGLLVLSLALARYDMEPHGRRGQPIHEVSPIAPAQSV
jgi:hypothetical protein